MKTYRKTIGDYGEDIAEKYLKKHGYRILSRNFSARGGEIDIIGFRHGTLVCFEVKTRSNNSYGRPAEAVDDLKIARINKALREFLNMYEDFGKIPVFYPLGITKKRRIRKKRIDVIEIYISDNSYEINHIKDFNGVEL